VSVIVLRANLPGDAPAPRDMLMEVMLYLRWLATAQLTAAITSAHSAPPPEPKTSRLMSLTPGATAVGGCRTHKRRETGQWWTKGLSEHATPVCHTPAQTHDPLSHSLAMMPATFVPCAMSSSEPSSAAARSATCTTLHVAAGTPGAVQGPNTGWV
jgi:hypothetical protein